MAEHSTEHAYRGTGSLKILIDRMTRGDRCRIYYKPFYRRDAFSDERYSPVFTPTVYSGQRVSMQLYLELWNGWETPGVAPYIRTMSDKELHIQGFKKLQTDAWTEISFIIPDTEGDLIDEAGIVLEGYSISKAKTFIWMNFRLPETAPIRFPFRNSGRSLAQLRPLRQTTEHGKLKKTDFRSCAAARHSLMREIIMPEIIGYRRK